MMTAQSHRRPTYPHHSFVSQGPTRENDEPAGKKTETRTRAEAGKKCMPGRRVEERVKSNEATKETGGSQQPSKGRAQGRGHGRHTASTTPHRSTGEGSTRGTREKRHGAPRHAPHRHHTHRTHPHPRRQHVAGEGGGGRAAGEGGASDPRHPSPRRTATPRGRPTATPTARNAGPQGHAPWGRCRVPTPAPTAPGTHGSRNPGRPLQRTGGRGRDSA